MFKLFRNQSKGRKILSAISMLAGCLLIGIFIYAGYLNNKVNAALAEISVSNGTNTNNITPDSPELAKTQEADLANKPFTMLLTAVDRRKGSGGTMNTDVIMLVTINPITRAATVVSIPRDMEIEAAQLNHNTTHKANYFYAYFHNKDEDSAMLRTKQFFSEYFQIPIDYMAVINFDGFRQLVDTMGGIEVDVDMDMRYVDKEDGTDINLKKGIQKLDGDKTLDFIRYRKSNRGTAESSDVARNQRQQLVLDKLIGKMTSFKGVTGVGQLIEVVGESMSTDIPQATLKGYLLSFWKFIPETTEFINLVGEWESPYIVVKADELERALEALRMRSKAPGIGK
ncbi:putative transcriptional regulator YvhJ [compost metagenome]